MLAALLAVNIPGLDGKIVTDAAANVAKKAAKKVVKKAAKAAATGAAAATSTGGSAAEAVTAAAGAADELLANVSAEPVDETPSALVQFLSSLDPVMTAAVLGLVLLVAFYIYRTRFSSTGQRGDTWLLLGAVGSGKTALFYRLKQGLFRPTHTSLKENDSVFVPQELQGKVSATRFVDVPGLASHSKLDAYKPVAKGVVFVIDGAHGSSLGKVSQQLYTLLVDPVLVARRTPFFVAVNKLDAISEGAAVTTGSPSLGSESDDDEAEAAPGEEGAVSAIARRLENLLDKTRSLQSTMADLGGSDDAARPRMLGTEGKPFRFSDSVCPITIAGVSAAKGDVEPLLTFLQTH